MLLQRKIGKGFVMPIGEFGRPPALPEDVGTPVVSPMYWMYEMGQASLSPARAFADATKLMFQNPLNPLAGTEIGKSIAAGCEVFERTTRRYGKPEWHIDRTDVQGVSTPVEIRTVWEKPCCRLLHFRRKLQRPLREPQPRVLLVAPMSGHYATLLRGTVEAFLPNHEVYIPTGSMRAWCRSRWGGSIWTIMSITSSRCCTRLATTCMLWPCASLRCQYWLRFP